MPYIEQKARRELDNGLREPANAGEYNYVLTKWLIEHDIRYNSIFGDVKKLCKKVGADLSKYLGTKFRYQDINDLIGFVSACLMEYGRRTKQQKAYILYAMGEVDEAILNWYLGLPAAYENLKAKENGDVF